MPTFIRYFIRSMRTRCGQRCTLTFYVQFARCPYLKKRKSEVFTSTLSFYVKFALPRIKNKNTKIRNAHKAHCPCMSSSRAD